MIVVLGVLFILVCLISIFRLFLRGHKILGILWFILYIVSGLLVMGTGIAAAIPWLILCVIAFIIP